MSISIRMGELPRYRFRDESFCFFHVNIDKDGRITEISVQRRKFLFFSAGVVKIKWDMISKIGKDVILVNVKG